LILRTQLVAAEGAPTFGGQAMALQMAQLGVPTTLIPDAAVFAMMARVNKVRHPSDVASKLPSFWGRRPPKCRMCLPQAEECGKARLIDSVARHHYHAGAQQILSCNI